MNRLYRSESDRIIAGVCGGIAEHFNIDTAIVRIIAVIALLPGGFPGLLAYIICWIAIPTKSDLGLKKSKKRSPIDGEEVKK